MAEAVAYGDGVLRADVGAELAAGAVAAAEFEQGVGRFRGGQAHLGSLFGLANQV